MACIAYQLTNEDDNLGLKTIDKEMQQFSKISHLRQLKLNKWNLPTKNHNKNSLNPKINAENHIKLPLSLNLATYDIPTAASKEKLHCSRLYDNPFLDKYSSSKMCRCYNCCILGTDVYLLDDDSAGSTTEVGVLMSAHTDILSIHHKSQTEMNELFKKSIEWSDQPALYSSEFRNHIFFNIMWHADVGK